MRVRAMVLLAAVWFATQELRGQVLIVDINNGPGAQFTQIQNAVLAAPDGATIRVRPGIYQPVDIDGKGVVIAGGPGVRIAAAMVAQILVHRTTARQFVALCDIEFDTGGSLGVLAQDCAGFVLVDSCHMHGDNSSTAGAGVGCQNCERTAIRDCYLHGYNSVFERGDVAIEGCDLAGATVNNQTPSPASPGLLLGGVGAAVFACCSSTDIQGGSGSASAFFPSWPGIVMRDGELRLGGNTGSVRAGQAPVFSPMNAIAGLTSSYCVRDPAMTLQPAPGAQPFDPNVLVCPRPLPALRTQRAGPGGTLRATLAWPHGYPSLIAAALPGPVLTPAGIDGRVWLDPASATLVAAGMPQPGQPLVATLPVPNATVFVGVTIAWQAFQAGLLPDTIVASNPSFTIVL